MKAELYFEQVEKVVADIRGTQMQNISQAADLIADCIQKKGLIHVFGAGHSHILAEEMSFRAGGLMLIDPILDPGYMVYGGARKGSKLERLPGFASIVLDNHDVRDGEVLIIVSNSGKNQGPVEMALYGKEKGLKIVAITSMKHSTATPSEHPIGKRLFELADVVIDNRVPLGDAGVEISPDLPKVGPLSTVACAAILNAIVTQVAFSLHERGVTPPIAKSGNLPDGRAYNERIEALYAEVLRRIRWA